MLNMLLKVIAVVVVVSSSFTYVCVFQISWEALLTRAFLIILFFIGTFVIIKNILVA